MTASTHVVHAQPRFTRKSIATAIAAAVVCTGVVQAQEAPQQRRVGAASLLEEVVVTARKREEGSQDVPLSISAFGADQLQALKVRDLTNLSVGLPNVALDDVGTARGAANFSIRGLGITSSIPSIDPTVGVFVNGIYLGLNNGIIFDVFDLESIEVLRGPQGILFGRNVTGGAILMNTKKPGEEFEATIRAAVDGGGDGGLNRYLMGTIGGPVTDTLGLKLTAYLNDDDGWHENLFDGGDVQAIKQNMLRGTAVWTPTDRAELVLRYEYVDIDGDGPVAQSHLSNLGNVPGIPQIPGSPYNADEDSFGANYDLVGFQTSKTDFLSVELNYDVDFGDGAVTALYGWRNTDSASSSDIDAQPLSLFHVPAELDAEQNSFELRYAGQFGNFNVTTGVYWFDNALEYGERRNLLGALTPIVTGGLLGIDGSIPFQTQDGGGLYDVETRAVFANVDYAITDLLTLSVGARYSDEEKSANIATLGINTNVLDVGATLAGGGTPVYVNPLTGTDTRCTIVTGTRCNLDFNDDDSWQTFSPKIGLSYAVSDDAQVYGHWSRGFRSGGYNLRNTSPTAAPGPFDEEKVDSFEVGYKSQPSWGRFNAAAFYTLVDDMQREINQPDAFSGQVQIIDNTADAVIWGFEVDGALSLTDNLILSAAVGYTNASYDSLRFDISGDGIIDSTDLDLELPRVPELTYNVGLNYDITLGSWGYASARVNYAFRDQAVVTENNAAIIPEQEILDAGLDFYSNSGTWIVSFYGRNLLDTVKWGTDTQLPALLGPLPLGGTFSPLTKGQVYGAEVTVNF